MLYEGIDFVMPRAYKHRVEGKTMIILIFLHFLSPGYLLNIKRRGSLTHFTPVFIREKQLQGLAKASDLWCIAFKF